MALVPKRTPVQPGKQQRRWIARRTQTRCAVRASADQRRGWSMFGFGRAALGGHDAPKVLYLSAELGQFLPECTGDLRGETLERRDVIRHRVAVRHDLVRGTCDLLREVTVRAPGGSSGPRPEPNSERVRESSVRSAGRCAPERSYGLGVAHMPKWRRSICRMLQRSRGVIFLAG